MSCFKLINNPPSVPNYSSLSQTSLTLTKFLGKYITYKCTINILHGEFYETNLVL